MRGQVDRAGFSSRPAVPSRTRFGWCRFAVLSIGDQASVHDVGQASFEAPQRFHPGLASGEQYARPGVS
jgi:hypothetical protein